MWLFSKNIKLWIYKVKNALSKLKKNIWKILCWYCKNKEQNWRGGEKGHFNFRFFKKTSQKIGIWDTFVDAWEGPNLLQQQICSFFVTLARRRESVFERAIARHESSSSNGVWMLKAPLKTLGLSWDPSIAWNGILLLNLDTFTTKMIL